MASDPVFKKIEITGTSTTSIEEAIQNAVRRAGETVHDLRWFEVDEIRGSIGDDGVSQYQVTVKIGFTVGE